ncbi:hypothetical protein SCHPADRAFT_911107 [Schizopora paradoxa]|uniref:Secreted protein n=1 Tax=Schizopora paradoxa TaxID=27342 RepID=A0A0H2R0V5_9AGAM|nr:hypothetical protein SCHPADRAFT_911107 [Schizopora paradoxa]
MEIRRSACTWLGPLSTISWFILFVSRSPTRAQTPDSKKGCFCEEMELHQAFCHQRLSEQTAASVFLMYGDEFFVNLSHPNRS